MDNEELIKTFYTAFQAKDWQTMQNCYHPEIKFSDPVFPALKGKKANAMWHMLVVASTNLEITYMNVVCNETTGSCQWEAKYSFSKTGRKVHNKIQAQFEFKDGLIINHKDTFDLWKWSRMALGTPGFLLGWTSFMHRKIQSMASRNLDAFIEKNSIYQQ